MKLASVLAMTLLAGAPAFAACPAGTTDGIGTGTLNTVAVCNITGTLSGNVHLTKENAYFLNGDVRVGGDGQNQSVLTIDAGTKIYGADGSFLVISRGSQILANGTQQEPIVFTSPKVAPARADWGGLVLTGYAPVNTCEGAADKCDNVIEGVDPAVAPRFGGSNASDSSGVLKFVRVEYAGFTLFNNSELNGITFYGVGNRTLVENIEAYKGADDGIEIFGGTVNMRNVVSIDSDDDGFDWDMGWTGNVQNLYIVVENASEADPNGIEADNYKKGFDLLPRSNPTLSNVTIIAKTNNPQILNGIILRHGTTGRLYNTLVTGTFKYCINIDTPETFAVAGVNAVAKDGTAYVEQTGLVMENSIVNCTTGQTFNTDPTDAFSVQAWFDSVPEKNNYVVSEQKDLKLLNEYTPEEGSPALDTGMLPPVVMAPFQVNGQWQVNADGSSKLAPFFTPYDYVGAFSSDANENWTAGWTVL